MTIFKYTMIKYLKSWSTWVILFLGISLAGVGGGFLPYHFLSTTKLNSATNYSVTIISIVAGVTSFLSIFISIFAGFKSAKMFKDEVEDGTFLVILSKPITRSKIILWKWIALQTLVLSYTFLTTLSFGITTSIFDTGNKISGLDIIGVKTLSSQIWKVSLYIWGILSLFGLIFTSIALVLSTKLSTGTTIGISIAIGVIIPITNIVSLFTHKKSYKSYVNSNLNKKKFLINSWKENLENRQKYDSALGSLIGYNNFENLEKDYENLIEEVQSNNNTLYNLGYKTGEVDGFEKAWPFDLNYHVSYISTYASDLIIPKGAKDIIYNNNANMGTKRNLLTAGRIVEKNKLNTSSEKKSKDKDKTIYNLAKNSIEKVERVRKNIWEQILKLIDLGTIAKALKLDINSILSVSHEIRGDELEKIQGTFGLDVDQMIQDGTVKINNKSIQESSYSLQKYSLNFNGMVYIVKRIQEFFEKIKTDPNFLNSSYNIYTTNWKQNSSKTTPGKVIDNVGNKGLPDNIKKVSDDINNFWKLFDNSKNDFTWNGRKGGTSYISVFNFIFNMIQSAFKNKESTSKQSQPFAILKFLIDSFNELLQPIDNYFVNYYLSNDQLKKFNFEEIENKYDWLNNWSNELGLSDRDSKIFKRLYAIYYQDPNFLVKIKRKLYIDKKYLLYFYLSLAVILVPFSYWITRRQDYR